MRFLAALVVLALQEPQPLPLVFVPPKDAKAADVEKAAKAFQKRIVDFGYKDIKAEVKEGEIHLKYEGDLTRTMESHIRELASYVIKAELRMRPVLTQRELDRFEPGVSAPDGAEWVGGILLLKEPVAPLLGRIRWAGKETQELVNKERDEKFEQKTGDKFYGPFGQYLELDKDLSAWAWKLTKAQRQSFVLFIDDKRIESSEDRFTRTPKRLGELVRWETAASYLSPDSKLGVCLNNPMPFALELKK